MQPLSTLLIRRYAKHDDAHPNIILFHLNNAPKVTRINIRVQRDPVILSP
ncbi:hypothetical protein PSCICL_06720 [Pseudomonas cichorii]|nr:hypothetical protein PSCICL_06720 [Pseudomonas cichorii]